MSQILNFRKSLCSGLCLSAGAPCGRRGRSVVVGAVAIASLALCSLVGCATDPNDVSFAAIRKNPTPELQALAERPSDVDRNITTTFDTNGRNFWNDLGRAWYVDRPSFLSPYPIAPTGGQPR